MPTSANSDASSNARRRDEADPQAEEDRRGRLRNRGERDLAEEAIGKDIAAPGSPRR